MTLESIGNTPHDVDLFVGGKIKTARTMQGMSQSELADKIGVSYQQVQKYERGTNRAAPSRLYDIARALSLPIAHFFPKQGGAKGERVARHRANLELVRNFESIRDAAARTRVYELVKTLAHST